MAHSGLGGNRALGLVLLEGGGVLRRGDREGRVLGAGQEVELAVVAGLEDPVATLFGGAGPAALPTLICVTHVRLLSLGGGDSALLAH